MTRRYCLFLLGAAALAQIARPRVGYIVDRSGALRPVEGVAGAFTLGPPIDHDVFSVAFSGKTLVIKKDHELIVDGKPFEAPVRPGGRLVHIDRSGKRCVLPRSQAAVDSGRRQVRRGVCRQTRKTPPRFEMAP